MMATVTSCVAHLAVRLLTSMELLKIYEAGRTQGGFRGFWKPPDSESLPFYVLAMQTLLRKAEIIFNTVASRCVADVRSQCFRLP